MAGLCDGSNGGKTDDGVVVTPAIKVNQACQLFGVKGDEILAHSLQDKEFEAKYSWNREMRRTARTDVPLAKATHDEEEENLQRERLHFLQLQTKLAEEDAELARQYDREEQLAKQQDRLKQEVRDQELAKRIQVLEIQEQGRPKVRRSRDDDSSEHGQVMLGGSVIRMSSFAGFHLDPTTGAGGNDDGLEEEERKQLMMMQDEELALALQEHEEMRAHRSARSQARIANRSTSGEHVTQQSVVIPAQPERFQSTAAPRRPSDVQTVLTSRGCDQADGFSHPPPPRPPPLSGQHPSRSHGPPTRPAPHAPVQHSVRPDDAYLNPIRTSNSNDVSGKTVTLVTSVGKSEFFKTIPANEARSLESKSQQQTTNHHSSSSAANNKTNFGQSNRKDSARKDSKRK